MTLAEETGALVAVVAEVSDGTEIVVLVATVTVDSAEETVTGASDAELTPRQSEAELLLTGRALKTNSRNKKYISVFF